MDAVKEESHISDKISANAERSKLRHPLRAVNKADQANTLNSDPVNNKDKGLLPPRIPRQEGRKGAKENRKVESKNAEVFIKLMELSRVSVVKIDENALAGKNLRDEFRGKIDQLLLRAEKERMKIEDKIMEKDLHLVTDPVSRAYFARKQEEIMGKLRVESGIGHGIG